ncbi:MAG: isopenicillin N synthase family dioxygenase [Neisseriaceae bacterium]
MDQSDIPIIDLTPLFKEDDNGIEIIASQLFEAYSTLGFAQLINHQIPTNIIDNIFQASKDFHELGIDEKMQLKYKDNLRGYIPMNMSTLARSTLGSAKKPNQSESFMILDESPLLQSPKWVNSSLAGHNIWPTQLPYFKKYVMEYYQAMVTLSKKLIRIFSIAMGMPHDYLDKYFTDPNIFLRLLYYPPVTQDTSTDSFGSAPHTDYGCLTLLAQDDTGGLQVKHPENDSWIDVPCLNNGLVLNTGQMMEIWSNGLIKATPHRVINSGNKKRYSIPFFYNCNLDTYVAPLSNFITETNPIKFTPINYGEHLERTLRSNYKFV